MKSTAVRPERLVNLRGKRSREVIAHELRRRGHGTDAKAIWRYETGRNQPSARVLPDYAEVLGAKSMDELYADDEEDSEAVLQRIARDAAERGDYGTAEDLYALLRGQAAGKPTKQSPPLRRLTAAGTGSNRNGA